MFQRRYRQIIIEIRHLSSIKPLKPRNGPGFKGNPGQPSIDLRVHQEERLAQRRGIAFGHEDAGHFTPGTRPAASITRY